MKCRLAANNLNTNKIEHRISLQSYFNTYSLIVCWTFKISILFFECYDERFIEISLSTKFNSVQNNFY